MMANRQPLSVDDERIVDHISGLSPRNTVMVEPRFLSVEYDDGGHSTEANSTSLAAEMVPTVSFSFTSIYVQILAAVHFQLFT